MRHRLELERLGVVLRDVCRSVLSAVHDRTAPMRHVLGEPLRHWQVRPPQPLLHVLVAEARTLLAYGELACGVRGGRVRFVGQTAVLSFLLSMIARGVAHRHPGASLLHLGPVLPMVFAQMCVGLVAAAVFLALFRELAKADSVRRFVVVTLLSVVLSSLFEAVSLTFAWWLRGYGSLSATATFITSNLEFTRPALGQPYLLTTAPIVLHLGMLAGALLQRYVLPIARHLGRLALQRLAAVQVVHPVRIASVLFLLALTFRVGVAAVAWDETFGYQVKGVPISDGANWDNMASDIGHGTRMFRGAWDSWGGRRPGFYLFHGALRALLGDGLWTTRVMHMLLGSVAAALIFDMLRRVVPVPVAILAALVHAGLRHDADTALLTSTEPVGYFFTVLALWFLLVGADSLGRSGRVPMGIFCLAGVALGFGNLVRLLNLAAAAPLTLFVGALGFWRTTRASRGRAALLAAACFAGGVALPVAPWLARQYVRYGFVAISDNSGEALYAATTPEYGMWEAAVSALAPPGATITERRAFYEDGTRAHLRAHRWWYVGHVARSIRRASVQLQAWRWPLVIGLLVLWASRRIGAMPMPRRDIAIFATALLLLARVPTLAGAIWIPAAVLAVLRLHPVGLLGLVLGPTVASIGLLGMGGSNRFTYSMTWQATALVLWLVWEIVDSRCGTQRPLGLWRAVPVPSLGRAGPLARGAGLAAVATLVLGGSVAVWRHTQAGPTPDSRVDAKTAARWIDRVLALERGAPYRPLREHLVVRQTSVRPEHIIELAAEEPVAHWNPVFAPRPYPFTAFRTLPPVPGVNWCVFPGRLPEEAGPHRPIILVGMPVDRPHDGAALEVLAIGYGDGPEAPAPGTGVVVLPHVGADYAAYLLSTLEDPPDAGGADVPPPAGGVSRTNAGPADQRRYLDGDGGPAGAWPTATVPAYSLVFPRMTPPKVRDGGSAGAHHRP